MNEDVEDDDDVDPPYNPNRDELEEHDDEFEVDTSSKKRRASTSSKKKSVAKNGKTSQKRKRANDDLEKTTKQLPKKFSHSTRRRKRCGELTRLCVIFVVGNHILDSYCGSIFFFIVDKALLEIPEDELDPSTLPIKHVILLAEHNERLAVCILSSNPFVTMLIISLVWFKFSLTVPSISLCRKRRHLLQKHPPPIKGT